MPRAPVKSTERLAYAEELGRLKAQEHFYKITHRFTPESLTRRLSDHVGKMLDTMTFRDTIDLIAAAGLTPVIQTALPEIQGIANFASFVLGHPEYLPLIGPLIGIFQTITGNPPAPIKPGGNINIQGVQAWLLSFAIAWCIVKFGDKLINAGITGLEGITALIGAALIPAAAA
jgi:hypothetical protein